MPTKPLLNDDVQLLAFDLVAGVGVRKSASAWKHLCAWMGLPEESVDVSEAFLPRRTTDRFYSVLESGVVPKDTRIIQLHFLQKPDSPPPTRMVKHRRSKRTSEEVLLHARNVLGAKDTISTFLLVRLQARPTYPMPPVAAIPLTTGSAVLEHVGAEYRAAQPGPGLQALRWVRKPKHLAIWVELATELDWTYDDLSDRVLHVCKKYIDAVT